MARYTRSAEARIRELNLELQFARKSDYACDYRFWMQRGGAVIVVGYLSYDENCDDPLDSCDAMGKVITRSDDKQYRREIGCNDSDQPEMDDFLERVARLRGIDLDEMMDSADNGVQIAFAMWEEARKRGQVGTPYAHPLVQLRDDFHLVEIDVHGNKRIDAVWVPDKYLMKEIMGYPEAERFEKSLGYLEEALEVYNAWARGECYGVCVDVFRRGSDYYTYELYDSESDACWGFVGSDHASNSLDETFAGMKKYFTIRSKNTCKSDTKGAASCL